jgi:group I intron endonuclease
MFERKWCVYKHTNKVNGKVYIGITSQDVRVRWNRGWGYQYCPHFGRAIQKYGWDNFAHEILYDGLTQTEAENWEINLIAEYHSADSRFGYNVSLGGSGAGKHSDETREKIGKVRRGCHHTEESKQKMRVAHLGKTFSEEHLQKLKTAQYGSKHHRARTVYQFTLSGELVAVYDCISEAMRQTGVPNQNIVKCCQGRRAYAGGYVWKYAEEVEV